MRQHSTGENKRRKWLTPLDISIGIKEACDEWERKLSKINWPTEDSRVKAYAWGLGPWYWKTLPIAEHGQLATRLREQEKSIKSHLHGRQRREMRMTVNAATAAREKARAEGRLTAVIRSICGTHVEQYSLHQLKLPNGETTSDPIIIHDAHATHWKKWLGGTGNSTFFDHFEIDWDNPQDLKDEFINFSAHIAIPLKIRETIWNALTVPQYKDAIVKQKLHTATNRTVTIDDLKAAIKRAPKTSVPGPSGLSYAMMKTWSPAALEEAHQAMTMIWETGEIPNWWKRKWLCPKSKVDPDLATLDDLRPISLIETTRKLWMGIIVGWIVEVWEEHEVLSPGQYGFRRGRGCESATIQVINALEDAEENSTEIHGSSWDIKRAFDTIRKPILQMSWERLGVPKK
jgi:hypothetical protein